MNWFCPLLDRNRVKEYVCILNFYNVILWRQDDVLSVEDVVEIVRTRWHISCELQHVILLVLRLDLAEITVDLLYPWFELVALLLLKFDFMGAF